MSAGVGLRAYAKGMVPLYEEHEARLERGIGLEAWAAMEEGEKALIIASRRIRLAVHNLQEEAQIEQAKRNTRRK